MIADIPKTSPQGWQLCKLSTAILSRIASQTSQTPLSLLRIDHVWRRVSARVYGPVYMAIYEQGEEELDGP